ncbi:MAG TPA: hypothetical protein VMR52_03305 [Dehalococcoidia bacterium]|nr:hypothetical protein [Dehalococcoidia bacterium]
MRTPGRLDKLYPTLSARERALMVLNAWKEGGKEDPKVRSTMPISQVTSFNRYIALINGCNKHLGPYLLLLRAQVEQLSLKLGWLQTIDLWSINATEMALAAFRAAKEPITKSGYCQLLEQERSRVEPVLELAELLAEQRIGDDATDAAWKRALSQARRDIEEAVDKGRVVAHKRGRRLMVQVGSFYDWLGQPTPLHPDWGLEYEVHPDDQDIALLTQRFDDLRKAVQNSPAGLQVCLDDEQEMGRTARFAHDIAKGLREAITSDLQYKRAEVAAVDAVIAEVSEEFAGEDPLLPELRALVTGLHAAVEDVESGLGGELNETLSPEEAVVLVRRLVHRELEENEINLRI